MLNDILDSENDALHPVKKTRPIPAGKIKKPEAAVLAALLFAAGLFSSLTISASFLYYVLVYIVITSLYSFHLKSSPVVDLFCISAGFLIRLQAGGEAFNIFISEWLFLSVFLLSIFLSTGKRLSEKRCLGTNAGSHRTSLDLYPEGFLEGAMYMTGSTVLVTYTMYVVTRPSLIYTVPLCCYGLFRYIFRVKSGEGGDPTESLMKDWQLFCVGLVWVMMFGLGVYR